jgi:K+ transporter
MRADNKGEGGVLALATLATRGLSGKARRTRRAILVLAVVGLALQLLQASLGVSKPQLESRATCRCWWPITRLG